MIFRIYVKTLQAIFYREILRFIQQYTRFIAALVRPLVWLFIFATGFRSVLGVSITPPYETYVLYETYITPGLCSVILLFSGMQSSLSIIYDREMGSMKILLTAPMPRWYILICKSIASISIAIVQVYVFLFIAYLWGIRIDFSASLILIPILYIAGLMFSFVGLFFSSVIKQLENFAGVMNFVIFPVFFSSSALYPLWRIQESSITLYNIAIFNPFTYATEAIRFALYGKLNGLALLVILATMFFFLGLSLFFYNPSNSKG